MRDKNKRKMSMCACGYDGLFQMKTVWEYVRERDGNGK